MAALAELSSRILEYQAILKYINWLVVYLPL
jgi:hypothetical protein